eukprot:13685167-Alexandrium_andersonii.AAC.1
MARKAWATIVMATILFSLDLSADDPHVGRPPPEPARPNGLSLGRGWGSVSYTHLRAHETSAHL